MILENIKVIKLAIIMGRFWIKSPYINQSNTPLVKLRYIVNDKSAVFLVLITLIACGINERVVKPAARIPIIKM